MKILKIFLLIFTITLSFSSCTDLEEEESDLTYFQETHNTDDETKVDNGGGKD